MRDYAARLSKAGELTPSLGETSEPRYTGRLWFA